KKKKKKKKKNNKNFSLFSSILENIFQNLYQRKEKEDSKNVYCLNKLSERKRKHQIKNLLRALRAFQMKIAALTVLHFSSVSAGLCYDVIHKKEKKG
uniref:Uncharacterized protein n=1 Tax=Glossina brevipalpis TaxID=37001 RepID=A0A1A9W205_9MUSC